MEQSVAHKLDVQEEQYIFPYHYIPHFSSDGGARRIRVLKWGLEYLCYQYHVLDLIGKLAPSSVLEVGCGDGYFIGALGNKIQERVGVDFSQRAIGFAKGFHPAVKFHVGDAAEIKKEFDVVVAIEVLEHIPDPQVGNFLRTLFDRTKTGGHVLICVPSVVLPLNQKHFRHYTKQLLEAQVQDAYSDAELVGTEYICHLPRWIRIYDRITINRFWIIEILSITNFMWRVLWKNYRTGTEKTGRHVISVFRKAE